MSVARRTRSGLVSVALAAALGLFGRPDARSAPPAAGAVPPAPWELEVERETAAQTSAIEQARVTRTIPAVVSRFENRVGRDASALNEYLLGRAQYYAGNPTAAKASMERCLRADPRFHFARSRLALLLVELKNYADAEAQLRQVLAAKPSQPEALELLTRIAVERKDWNAALNWLNQRLSADPSDVLARQNLAFVHLQRKDWAAAKREVSLLRSADPASPAYRYMLAVVQLELGEVEPGLALLESVVREQPGNLEALSRLQRAYVGRQDWPRVRSTLERMLPYLDEEPRRRAIADIDMLKKGPPVPGARPEPRRFSWDDLLRVVEDPDPSRREDALIAVYDGCLSGELKQVPSSVLRRITSDVEPSDAARSIVVKILGTLAPEQVLPLLSVALYDESERVRMLSAEAIGGTKRAIGLAYLFPFLSSEGMSVPEYQSVRAALAAITGFADLPPGIAVVASPADVTASRESWRRWRLSDASDAVKREAIRQLVAYREQSSERFLYDFVLDPSYDVMSEAYRAMREAVARAPRDPAERKTFGLFPALPDAEVTRASMRMIQDRVIAWWTSYVAERRAYIQARTPSAPGSPGGTPPK